MKRNKFVIIAAVVTISIVIGASVYLAILNQGTQEPNNPEKSPTATPVSTDGAELYATYCAACHKSLESSTKKDRSAELIKYSIYTFPSMYSLTDLTDQQIQAIADALKQ